MSDTAIAAPSAAPQPAAPSAAPQPAAPSAWKNPGGPGFHDLLDIVNPLQHLPIIGSIYRWATGDRPGEAAQIAGDGLYGGPIGVALGLVDAATEDAQGRDLGERTLAALFGPNDKAPAATAAATPASPAATPAARPAPVAAVPDHAPMPLFGGIAQMPPAATAAPQGTAARAFLAHNATFQRQLSNGRTGPPPSAPVPLVLPAGTLPMSRPGAAAWSAPAATAPAATTPAPTPATPGAPVDVSQKMMDALDKYMRLEQERKAGSGADPAPPPVDLSM